MSNVSNLPAYEKRAFLCPHCNELAIQQWGPTAYLLYGPYIRNHDLFISKCENCKNLTYWHNKSIIFPQYSTAPMPHPKMPASIVKDYIEARSIAHLSPRGAAALLRLCVQKLMIELGELGKDINKDIASLVKKGLPPVVQQALDIVRVIGNESVHPGELNLDDDQETTFQLFELVNFIIDDQFSRGEKMAALFSKLLPENKRKGIEIRDTQSED